MRLILAGTAASALSWPVLAQPAGQGGPVEGPERVIPAENVRVEYAQVLRVEPVYQTLRATRTEERCDTTPVVEVSAPSRKEEEPGGAFGRMVESVRGFLGGQAQDKAAAPEPARPVDARRDARCQLVQVDRQFQRPIAYDVDYVYKGTKYRSRLAEDPGNRLRIRVAVTPLVSDTRP
jgi:uncharacterized protein YcfJ